MIFSSVSSNGTKPFFSPTTSDDDDDSDDDGGDDDDNGEEEEDGCLLMYCSTPSNLPSALTMGALSSLPVRYPVSMMCCDVM